ncbi:imidazolonepropionase [Leucobacter muris]|uniref:imidazolonepropionase n=1 Tax=Leucobacter muris TaxID=1935379 RepID=A0ABX5QCX2_9MICO|nr:amidohydrolase family protein [Leucobacter muris]QAB16845.1 imidazolonepropionase [Leucobacter muris]
MIAHEGSSGAGDLDIVGIGELHRVSDRGSPRRGSREQANTSPVRDAVVSIRGGRVVAAGHRSEVPLGGDARVIDAGGGVVTPGLVESHAHPLFAGNRSHEYTRRLRGLPASIIGDDESGGIKYTVRRTREADGEFLAERLTRFLDAAADSGVTTCEVKGGYGLELEEERRHLEIISRVAARHEVRVVPTFAAAHDVPAGMGADAHAEDVASRMLPLIASLFPAALNDVTCERGVLTPHQAELVLHAARLAGLRSIVHADAFADSGGWGTAVRAEALSAHHLTYTPEDVISRHAGVRTVATVLPMAELVYLTDRRAPARAFIDHSVPLAVATDYCSSIGASSLLRTMLLAAPWFGLDPAETLVAATLNAAYAIGASDRCGSIDPGKSGDLVIFAERTLDDVFWAEPVPPTVVRAGHIVRSHHG